MIRYKVYQDFTLTQDHLDALNLLYQPVLSYPAVSLYLTLHANARYETFINQRDLLSTLQIDAPTLDAYRQELEQFNLVQTFQEDVLELILKPCLTPSEFLSHDVYSRLFAIVKGQHQFAYYCDLFRKPKPQNLNNDISVKFDVRRVSSWDLTSEESYAKAVSKELQHYQFDAQSFFDNFLLFPKELLTPDVLKLVAEYGSNYKVSQNDMKSMLLQTVKQNPNVFDVKIFAQHIATRHGQESLEQVDNAYDLEPVSFLAYLQQFEVSHVDESIIKRLKDRYTFENGAFNLLIETMLKNGHTLNYSYAISIADPWVRQGVQSYDDALAALKQFEQRMSGKPKSKGARSTAEQPVYSSESEQADQDLLDAFKANLLKDSKEGA